VTADVAKVSDMSLMVLGLLAMSVLLVVQSVLLMKVVRQLVTLGDALSAILTRSFAGESESEMTIGVSKACCRPNGGPAS
jgi:hypothetical protein